jgi:hypothetical protein
MRQDTTLNICTALPSGSGSLTLEKEFASGIERAAEPRCLT